MNGIQQSPVKLAGQSARFEPRAASEKRALPRLGQQNELQPGPSGQFHFGAKRNFLSRGHFFDAPEIHAVTGLQLRSARAAARHPHAAQPAIEPSPHLPQKVAVQPARLSAEALQNGEHLGSWRMDRCLPNIANVTLTPERNVRVAATNQFADRFIRASPAHGRFHRRPVTHRNNFREESCGMVAAADDFGFQAFNQGARDPAGNGVTRLSQ